MRKERSRGHDREAPGLPFTPMVDVVFQLLVFFLVTYRYPGALAHLPVHMPSAGRPGPEFYGAHQVVDIDSDGYRVKNRQANLETIRPWLTTLARLDQEVTIVIRVASESEHKMLMDLLNVCVEVKLTNLVIFPMD